MLTRRDFIKFLSLLPFVPAAFQKALYEDEVAVLDEENFIAVRGVDAGEVVVDETADWVKKAEPIQKIQIGADSAKPYTERTTMVITHRDRTGGIHKHEFELTDFRIAYTHDLLLPEFGDTWGLSSHKFVGAEISASADRCVYSLTAVSCADTTLEVDRA